MCQLHSAQREPRGDVRCSTTLKRSAWPEALRGMGDRCTTTYIRINLWHRYESCAKPTERKQSIRCYHTAVPWAPKSHSTTFFNYVTKDPKSRAKETNPSGSSASFSCICGTRGAFYREKLRTYTVQRHKEGSLGRGVCIPRG